MAPDPRPDANASPPPALGPPGDPVAHDRQLIAAVLRKDRKAAAELVSAHADAVYAYVRHRLTPRVEHVEDVVHDVFLAALANAQGYRAVSPLRAWLLGIARHKVEDYYRKRLRGPETVTDADEAAARADDGPPIEERIDRSRAVAKTQRILRMLPEAYGLALLWRYWENRSVREIATATGKTEKAIERLLARARTRFRALWNEV
jgi:RNA polymerase sigma-70 factor, ECF subfamily